MPGCIHVYPFVARNHGGIPFSGVCPIFITVGVGLLGNSGTHDRKHLKCEGAEGCLDAGHKSWST